MAADFVAPDEIQAKGRRFDAKLDLCRKEQHAKPPPFGIPLPVGRWSIGSIRSLLRLFGHDIMNASDDRASTSPMPSREKAIETRFQGNHGHPAGPGTSRNVPAPSLPRSGARLSDGVTTVSTTPHDPFRRLLYSTNLTSLKYWDAMKPILKPVTFRL